MPPSQPARLRATALVGSLLFVACTAVAIAQRGGGEKDDGAGLVVMWLLPATLILATGLQVALMGVFPRFSRRCAAAVRMYRWQAPLLGGVGWILAAAVAGVATKAAGGDQRAGIPVVCGAFVVASLGGVGISLLAGRWALKRVTSDVPAHPIVEVFAGGNLLGWGMLLVPFAGQLAWVLVTWMSLGAFVLAIVRGRSLDEARSWRDATPTAQPVAAPPPEPSPPPPVQVTAERSDDSQVF